MSELITEAEKIELNEEIKDLQRQLHNHRSGKYNRLHRKEINQRARKKYNSDEKFRQKEIKRIKEYQRKNRDKILAKRRERYQQTKNRGKKATSRNQTNESQSLQNIKKKEGR